MTRRKVAGWTAVVLGTAAIIVNFWAFGPLGAPLMFAIEFTALVFVMLGLILCRSTRSEQGGSP